MLWAMVSVLGASSEVATVWICIGLGTRLKVTAAYRAHRCYDVALPVCVAQVFYLLGEGRFLANDLMRLQPIRPG